MSHVYFSLGSNLGDRWQNLVAAIESLGGLMTITAVSPVYETTPWGPNPAQPNFYNCCVAGTTNQSLAQLLVAIGQLERRLGRRSMKRWGPHRIDIDLLFMDDLVTSYGGKQVPHHGIEKYAFVLAPLLDIAPDLVNPETGTRIERLYQLADKTGLVEILMEHPMPEFAPPGVFAVA